MPAARTASHNAASAWSQTSSAPARTGGRSENFTRTSVKPKSW